MKKFFCLLVFLLSVTSSYGLLNDLIILKNHTRPGYDDNIFTRTAGNETGSYYVEQIVSIDAILSASQQCIVQSLFGEISITNKCYIITGQLNYNINLIQNLQ